MVESSFGKHLIFVLDVGKRSLKFTALGVLGLSTFVATAYIGTHLWVEYVGMASELDEEVKKWEWHLGHVAWSGNTTRGGTDPDLGLKARHIVRSAWMAYNWGVGESVSMLENNDLTVNSLVDPRSQKAAGFLRQAISLAESQGTCHPKTISTLLVWRAIILQRLYPVEAQRDLESAFRHISGQSLMAARIAVKLGDLHSCMDQSSDALRWWVTAIDLVQGKTPSGDYAVIVPINAPTSPLAQRIMASVLVSLSAHHAKTGALPDAQAIEESALRLLRSISSPDSLSSATPPQSLHSLYILQRSSLLFIHLAEVLYARQHSSPSSMQCLASAVESSERVAFALTDLPLYPSENSIPKVSIPQQQLIRQVFCSSRSMNDAARNLLRDARRTAAEAWNMMGILYETRQGDNSKAAFECYERAISWAGVDDAATDRRAADDTLEVDWRVFWGNYSRLKRVLDIEQQQV